MIELGSFWRGTCPILVVTRSLLTWTPLPTTKRTFFRTFRGSCVLNRFRRFKTSCACRRLRTFRRCISLISSLISLYSLTCFSLIMLFRQRKQFTKQSTQQEQYTGWTLFRTSICRSGSDQYILTPILQWA